MTAMCTSSPDDGVDLGLYDLFQHIIKNKRSIILIAIVTLLFSMTYVLLKPNKYQATILLEVHHNLENSLGSMGGSSQKQSTAMLDTEPVALQIALIRSTFILSPVVKALGMMISVKPVRKSFFDFTSFKNNFIKISELNIPVKYLKKKLLIVIGKDNHYKLYAEKKKLILEGHVGELAKSGELFAIKVDKIYAPQGSEFIVVKLPEAEVIQQLRARLTITDLSGPVDASSNKVAVLQVSVVASQPDEAVNIVNEISYITQLKDRERKALQAKKSLTFLYQQLPMIQESLKESENKLNNYQSSREIMDVNLHRQYLISQLSAIDKEIELTHSKWMDMSEMNTAQHPFVIALHQKYQTLKKQRSTIFVDIKKLSADDQIEVSLKRDLSAKNNLYMLLLKRIQEQQVVTAGVVSDIQVLSQANDPDNTTPLRLTLVILCSLFIGLILGCLAIIAKQLNVRRASANLKFNALS